MFGREADGGQSRVFVRRPEAIQLGHRAFTSTSERVELPKPAD
jgi:hypothetical protein